MTEQENLDEFFRAFSMAIKIVNKGTQETRVSLWGSAEGKDFILSIRQATDADREDIESGAMLKVEKPGPNNVPPGFPE